jgi:type VI secretion system protein ImpG
LNKYFVDELRYLREMGPKFARLNPQVAKYLDSEQLDPDVERLLEGFAFLTAALRQKIDDEQPEFTRSLLSLIQPHMLRPFPSVTLMKLEPVARAISSGQRVPRGTRVLSEQNDGKTYRFQTTAECLVYPVRIKSAEYERAGDRSTIAITLATTFDVEFRQLSLERLRLNFTGKLVSAQQLYRLMGRHLDGISLVSEDRTISLRAAGASVRPIGLDTEEALLPPCKAVPEGPRLLQEYFTFVRKFLGFDVSGLGQAFSGWGRKEVQLLFGFDRALPVDFRLKADDISLYCVPAINLFTGSAEPIFVDHRKNSYPLRVQGEADNLSDILTIDEITGSGYAAPRGGQRRMRVYSEFETIEHDTLLKQRDESLYYRHHIQDSVYRPGRDHALSFVTKEDSSFHPNEEVISAQLTCFNPVGCNEIAAGEISKGSSSAPTFVTYRNLTTPTEPTYPTLDALSQWQLISSLAFNPQCLTDRDLFVSVLANYDFSGSRSRQEEKINRQKLNAIHSVSTQPTDIFIRGLPVRGMKTCLKISEEPFESEGEMFVFGTVLARYLSNYATINSFLELEITGLESGETYRWPAEV